MRRDEPNRHGRAADALIATYVRELLADEPEPPRAATERDLAAPSPAVLTVAADTLAADAAL